MNDKNQNPSILKKPSPVIVVILCVIACLIWGMPYKLLKIFYNEMRITPDSFGSNYTGQMLLAVSMRFLIAGILTLTFAKFTKQKVFALTKKQWCSVATMGLVSTTISYFFFNIGNVNIASSANASLLGQSGIFFGVILAPLAYKNEKYTLQKILALILGFAGLFISQLKPGYSVADSFSSITLTGEGFMLIHGVVFALATMLGKKTCSDLNSFVMTGWALVLGSIYLAIVGIFFGGQIDALNFTPTAVVLLLILAAASAIPFSIWYWCTQYMEISRLSMFKFLIPVSSSLIAVATGEPFTLLLGVGLAMVCSAIVLINIPWKQQNKRKK